MGATSGKLAGGLLLLIGVWVGVYWVWEPSRPPITLDRTGEEVAPPPLMNVQRQTPAESDAKPAVRTETKPTDAARSIAVIPPEFFDYTVQPGDTFESISTKFWGSPMFASVVTRANGLGDAGRLLTPGRTIRLVKDPNNLQGVAVAQPDKQPVNPPAVVNPPKQKPTETAKVDPPKQTPPKTEPPKQESTTTAAKNRTYVVQSGDSLSKIAKRFYDDASQWERIYEANKNSMKGPHDLKLGAVLIIPE